ncbi:MAG: hypothetical protein Q9174_006328, partial [Haloplaca sp. 1 TL-2023]
MSSRKSWSSSEDEGQEVGGPRACGENAPNVGREWSLEDQAVIQGLGLENPKNRCYLNSVVIALLHVPKFSNWLKYHGERGQQEHAQRFKKEDCAACALWAVSNAYWQKLPDEASAKATKKEYGDFLKLIARVKPEKRKRWTKWKQNEQHDAADFYTWLRDLICDQLKDIDAGFEKYFANETISELECDSEICKRSDGTKQYVTKQYVTHLNQGPDILLTQLNRFQQDEKESWVKNSQRVSYDETLDLSPYVKNGVSLKYRLLAIVLHWGTLLAGHYKTIGKTPGGQWATYNNEDVQQSSLKEALGLGNSEFTPYLLFWQKQPLEVTSPSSAAPKKRAREEDGDVAQENGRSSPK